jgi:hypothetical protein
MASQRGEVDITAEYAPSLLFLLAACFILIDPRPDGSRAAHQPILILFCTLRMISKPAAWRAAFNNCHLHHITMAVAAAL